MSASQHSTVSFKNITSKFIVTYRGKLIATTVTDRAIVADEWVQEITNQYARQSKVVVGLDVEWIPTSTRCTSNKSATLQLCIDNNCLILQLFYMDYFPMSLKNFFMDSKFIFVGVEVEKDTNKLGNEYGLRLVSCKILGIWPLSVGKIIYGELVTELV